MSEPDLILLRHRASEAVELLLALLDAIDADADCEITATETRGAGFIPTAALTDDDEDGHDAEALEAVDYPISVGAGA